MAQEPVLRPFGKADFGHQLRLEPGRLLVRPRLRRVLERRVGALQAGDGPFQLVRLGCPQARTHAADVAEPAVVDVYKRQGYSGALFFCCDLARR